MKVIDLLNKIANGEEIPKRIKFRGQTLDYDSDIDYKDYLDSYLFGNKCCINKEDLNEEVEIIEEDKKIEELNELEYDSANEIIIKRKINEIIDVINKMKENK